MRALVAAAVVLLSASPAVADVTAWDFSSHLGAVGSDKVYSAGQSSVELRAFLTPSTTGVLFEKDAGAEEQGVGVCPPVCGGDGEIQVGSWLRIDLAGATGLTHWQIDVDSVQRDELYSLFTSSDPLAFGAWVPCGTRLSVDTLAPLCGGTPLRYVFLAADAFDVDLHRLSAVAVPESATGLLVGLAVLLLGLAHVGRGRGAVR